MGKTGGFLEHARQEPGYRPAHERIKDFKAVEIPFADEALRAQLARCMECGTPFCHGYGCPLANTIPELNDLAWQERWEEALALLLAANPLPEFTARLCPALCEASCVLAINDEAVTIRQIELAIVERGFAKGYLKPMPPSKRLEEKIAVIGSGPAGLAAAATLNKAGYQVVVYERAAKIGGMLRYGIPDFKLEKWVLDRRIRLMEQEGVRFETGVNVGTDISGKYLQSRFNAICLCGGASEPRDLKVPGRDLAGIHFAMDYLAAQNKKNTGERLGSAEDIDARGKNVVIIGGGDTGADCLGTAIRQGAKSVTQLEILPEPPKARTAAMPWPMWPVIRRDSTSHKEGGVRRWGVNTLKFHGRNGRVTALDCVEVEARRQADGRLEFIPRPGTEFTVEAELVLLALGYVVTGWERIAASLHLEHAPPAISPRIAWRAGGQAGVKTAEAHTTSIPGVFIAGDIRSGPSLVARAIADGMAAAREIMGLLSRVTGQ
ncbi:MAG: glutamate synthase subunit beta [Kiritimatiellia bacterium]|jgi:glutamate synthase (NADPH/NADH) small chain